MLSHEFTYSTKLVKQNLKGEQPSNKKLASEVQSQRLSVKRYLIFGGLAIIVSGETLDPWLCVAGFHRVCLYRMSFLCLQYNGLYPLCL